MNTASPSVNWQAGFLSLLPAVETHAKIKFRKLRAERREEAIQEAIASAAVSYQLLAAQGKLHVVHPSTLADYAVKAVRSGRHVGGHQDAAQDIMSPIAQRRYGVRVESFEARRAKVTSDGWRQVAVEGRKRDTSVPDLAAFRIDFPRWLQTLSRRDQSMVAAFIDGQSTSAVADRFGVTSGRVSQLRRKFERLWSAFHGEWQA